MDKYYFGIDIGGTKMEYALYNENFEELSRERIATQRDLGYESVIERLVGSLKEEIKRKEIAINQVVGIGVGLPGTIDPSTKVMINGNSEIFIQKDFRSDLKKAFYPELDVRIANDANLFALAEHHRGAGVKYEQETGIKRNDQISMGIILGTGNGGGLIINGKIFSGKHGGGVEVGHHVLYNNGRPCYCGRKGCSEQYLCGPSVEANYLKQTGKNKMATDILRGKDRISVTLMNQYKHDLLEFLTNLSTLFDPDYFVLGGGISKMDELYEGLEEKLWGQVFVKGTKPRVYKHEVGDSSGVLGASMLFN